MCGITFTIRLKPPLGSPTPDSHEELFASLRRGNASRGPDCQCTYTHQVVLDDGREVEVCLSACVLGLRGQGVTSQPLVGTRGMLAWNGQVRASLLVHISRINHSANSEVTI